MRAGPVSVVWDAHRSGRAVLRLDGDLTIGAVEACHGIVGDVLARASVVAIEAGGLAAVDLAGLQLLMAGRRQAERAGKLFHLAAPAGGALREALIAAGLVADGDGGEGAGWVDAFWLAG
ncbi:MAG: STAS domain-containing protein [Alphaproteobacteria bacterium]